MDAARRKAIDALISNRGPSGYWSGYLSSSALSTATAITALYLMNGQEHAHAIHHGAYWLVQTQLDDGSWGDTVKSQGNLSTTLLCWSALGAICGQHVQSDEKKVEYEAAVTKAGAWLTKQAGGLSSEHIAHALNDIYGKDRTFSVPILTMAVLCGRFGNPQDPSVWTIVPQLPFELAALPQSCFRLVDMQVVSYALPALIAIGQVRHAYAPTRYPVALIRHATIEKTLRTLERIQPRNGGFLEATPLTSFVTMSLAGMGRRDHVVAERSVAFLTNSQRADGSWPIDTNLSTWGTTLSVNALAAAGHLDQYLDLDSRKMIREWLLSQQWCRQHPYTGAKPGGWAWTDLPGGVPDADDTSGAIIALWNLESAESHSPSIDVRRAAAQGLSWLSNLANRDGGIPTFCRGWGRLPFDTSCPDITAHFLRAHDVWSKNPEPIQLKRKRIVHARRYLSATQRSDGSWSPLWFGNEHHLTKENPVYGTAKVVLATGDSRGVQWLVNAIHKDGGIGGGPGIQPSIEETAVTIEALASCLSNTSGLKMKQDQVHGIARSLDSTVEWLVSQTDGGRTFPTSPIGLYFAKLWYADDLYPLVFTAAALERVASLNASH
ncbi:MAG: prenyltransferase/squalene oxidase repeat-containing protein [Pirellulales bacterium]